MVGTAPVLVCCCEELVLMTTFGDQLRFLIEEGNVTSGQDEEFLRQTQVAAGRVSPVCIPVYILAVQLPLITTRVCDVMYSISQERNERRTSIQYSDACGRHMAILPMALIDSLDILTSTS